MRIIAADITAALKIAAKACYKITGIPPDDVEVRSLRAGGATALLAAGVPENRIELMGRWHSDAMCIYLRTGAFTFAKGYAQKMLNAGACKFAVPNTETTAELGDLEVPLLPDLIPDSLVDLSAKYLDDVMDHPDVPIDPDDRN